MDRKYYNLKAIIIGQNQVGKTSVQNSISDKPSENFILIEDQQVNTNPPDDTQIQDVLLFLVVYDITNKQSFDAIQIDFCNKFGSEIQRNFQFVFLIGNKRDLEEKREVETTDGEFFAKANFMTFFEVSAETGKSIDMLKKMIRIKSQQMMKKFAIQPSDHSLEFQYMLQSQQEGSEYEDEQSQDSYSSNEEGSQSNSQSEDEKSDSQKSSKSSYCTPPKFPQRPEISPDFFSEEPPPLPKRNTIFYLNGTPSQKIQEKNIIISTENFRPQPITIESPLEKKQETHHRQIQRESIQGKESSLISSLASKPLNKINLNARFNAVAPKLTPKKQQPDLQQDIKNLSIHRKTIQNLSSEDKYFENPKKIQQDEEKKIFELEQKKQIKNDGHKNLRKSINNHFKKSLKKYSILEGFMEQTIKLSEHVHKVIEEEKNEEIQDLNMIPKKEIDNIISEFQCDNLEEKRLELEIEKITNVLKLKKSKLFLSGQQELTYAIKSCASLDESQTQGILPLKSERSESLYYSKGDPRFYLRNTKPLLILAIEYNKKVHYVDVYFEDSPQKLAERFLINIKKPLRNQYQVSQLSQIFMNAIENLDKQIQNQDNFIKLKRKEPQTGWEEFFRMKVEESTFEVNQLQKNKTKSVFGVHNRQIRPSQPHLRKISQRNYPSFNH